MGSSPRYGRASGRTSSRAAVRSWVLPGSTSETHSGTPRGAARACTFPACSWALPEYHLSISLPSPAIHSSGVTVVVMQFGPQVGGDRAGVMAAVVIADHQPGHDPGHDVVMVRVATGGQLRPPPDRHQPDPPV